MLANDKLASAIVGATANHSVKDVMYAAPTADETRISGILKDEIGRIESKVSVLLSHIEGHYESQVANANLKVTLSKYWRSLLAVAFALGNTVGVFVGHYL